MKNLLILLGVALICGCQRGINDNSPEKIKRGAIPFDLKNVRLLDSPFRKAMQLDAEWLLDLKPDRLLYQYRLNSGLQPKDSSYGGWEERFSGHILGHYLSACAMMFASSGDERFRKRVDYIIDELDTCQRANRNGYVGGVRNGREIFARIKKGEINLKYNGFVLNGGRVPWYNMHKLFAGLIDAYKYAGNEKAKNILISLSNWELDLLSGLSEQDMQKMLQSENGGMNESLAIVYSLTGNIKYIELARRFNHKGILTPLSESRDQLDGKHANSQIPKVIGALRQFELDGDSTLFKAADFFWNTIIHHHSYVIGGNAESEYLGLPDHIYDHITDFTSENCGTYNMLKLTRDLFCLNPSVEKADYYERALYNQILASQNPRTGMVTYFNGLAPGSSRNYCSQDNSFWCCTGTGFENHAKYGESIYFKDRQGGLIVNLFIASELNWEEKGLKLVQETKFPFSDFMIYKINLNKPSRFTVKLRLPGWAQQGFNLEINGTKQSLTASPGSYLVITREWKDSDVIKYQLPMSLSCEPAPGSKSVIAFLYGPIVLAADFGLGISNKRIPVLVSDNIQPEDLISVRDKESLQFDMNSEPENVRLIPYFLTGENTTCVYFRHFNLSELKTGTKTYSEFPYNFRKLEEYSTDCFRFSDKNYDPYKKLAGNNITFKDYGGHKCVEADKGWFSFKMKTSAEKQMELVCTYWNDPAEENSFDIFIDNEFLANILINKGEKKFISRRFHLPLDYNLGKKEVTVLFKAVSNLSAGPLSECRIITYNGISAL